MSWPQVFLIATLFPSLVSEKLSAVEHARTLPPESLERLSRALRAPPMKSVLARVVGDAETRAALDGAAVSSGDFWGGVGALANAAPREHALLV